MNFISEAVPLDEVGYADGHELDALISARTMEQWEIRLAPERERWIWRHVFFEAMVGLNE